MLDVSQFDQAMLSELRVLLILSYSSLLLLETRYGDKSTSTLAAILDNKKPILLCADQIDLVCCQGV